MKKIINTVIIIVLSSLGLLIYVGTQIVSPQKRYETIRIDGKTYKMRIAQNQAEWARGLMLVRKPVDYDGMVFYFPSRAPRPFWNVNTVVNLDIMWMDGDKVVGKSFLPSVEKSKQVVTVSSPAPVNKVVEIIK